MSRGKRSVLALAAAAGLALAVTAGLAIGKGPDASGLKKGSIKVGYGNNLSGFLAVHDHLISDGARVAVDQINKKGGIGGKVKIDMTIKDTKSDSTESVKVANEFLAAHVAVMMLPCNTDFQVAMAARAKSSKTFMLSPCNGDPTLPKTYPTYYGVGMGGNAQGAQLATYVKSKKHKRAWVLTSSQNLYIRLMAKYFKKAAPSRGIKILKTDDVPLGNDYSAEVTKIKNASPKPDVIMTGLFNPFLGTLIKNLRAQGVKTQVVSTDGAESAPILALPKATVEGTGFTTFGFPTRGSATAKFYVQYKKKYGKNPDGSFAALGYESVKVLEAAVKQANSTDPKKIMKVLSKGITVNGALGKIHYLGHNNHNPAVPVVVDRIHSGKFVLVMKSVPTKVPAP
jgi:branched-chain amino acid transport system substrate-binding protein